MISTEKLMQILHQRSYRTEKRVMNICHRTLRIFQRQESQHVYLQNSIPMQMNHMIDNTNVIVKNEDKEIDSNNNKLICAAMFNYKKWSIF